MEADEKECPFCAETIKAKAKVCKHCGKELSNLDADADAKSKQSVAEFKQSVENVKEASANLGKNFKGCSGCLFIIIGVLYLSYTFLVEKTDSPQEPEKLVETTQVEVRPTASGQVGMEPEAALTSAKSSISVSVQVLNETEALLKRFLLTNNYEDRFSLALNDYSSEDTFDLYMIYENEESQSNMVLVENECRAVVQNCRSALKSLGITNAQFSASAFYLRSGTEDIKDRMMVFGSAHYDKNGVLVFIPGKLEERTRY